MSLNHKRKPVHISVGNFNVDIAVYLDRIVQPGDSFFAKDLSIRPGGAATNYAVAASSYGHPTYLVASVSKSEFVKPLLDEVAQRGVLIDHVKYVEEPPGLVIVLVHPDGERSMIRYPGANRFLTPDDVEEDLIKRAHVIHFASVHPTLVMRVGERARKEPIIISYDPGPFSENILEHPRVLAQLDILFVNDTELSKITRQTPLVTLLKKGPRCIVVKRGVRGAYAVECGGMCYHGFSEPIRKPVDTTGAGDAFNAFFNAVYVESGDLARALQYGVAAGTFKTICKSSFICWDPGAFELQLEKTVIVRTSCDALQIG